MGSLLINGWVLKPLQTMQTAGLGWVGLRIQPRMLSSMNFFFFNPDVIHLSEITTTTLKQRSKELCLTLSNHP